MPPIPQNSNLGRKYMFMRSPQGRAWYRSRRVRAVLIATVALAGAVPVALQVGVAQAQPTPPSLSSPPLRIDALYHRTDEISVPIRPTSGRWSVGGVHSDAGSDWDLTVTGSNDSAGSDQYGDRTDFVAVDGSVYSSSDPKVRTTLWSGDAGYDLAFNDQTGDDRLAVHWVDQGFQVGGDSWPSYSLFSQTSKGQWTAGVADVALVAGHDYLIASGSQ